MVQMGGARALESSRHEIVAASVSHTAVKKPDIYLRGARRGNREALWTPNLFSWLFFSKKCRHNYQQWSNTSFDCCSPFFYVHLKDPSSFIMYTLFSLYGLFFAGICLSFFLFNLIWKTHLTKTAFPIYYTDCNQLMTHAASFCKNVPTVKLDYILIAWQHWFISHQRWVSFNAQMHTLLQNRFKKTTEKSVS